MATVEKRSVSLSPDLAATIDQAVADGEYGNASEVVREALRQWKARRELHGYTVEELRLLWDAGLKSGAPQPLSEDFVDRIKARGRARTAGPDGRS